MFETNKTDGFTEPEDFEYVEPADDEAVDPDDSDSPSKPRNDSPATETKKPRRRFRKFKIWTAILTVVILSAAFWIRYLNPYVVETTERGYVVELEHRGIIFKTWEGEMITLRSLTSPDSVYTSNLLFSVDDPRVAEELKRYNGTGRIVTVTYNRYFGALPWRGQRTCIVTGVEPAD